MKDKYNIQFNPPELSEEQIAKHKDFEALMTQFEAMPKPQAKVRQLGTRRRIAIYASAAAVLLLFIWVGVQQLSLNNTITPRQYATPFINPPIAELQIPSYNFKIKGTEGGVVEDSQGSKITFPENAFVDENGNLVSGDVEIKFRALQDFIDFFITGIPMLYDTASQQYLLESSGMIEIYAFQNGNPIFLNPNKPIAVELKATIPYQPSQTYQVYSLDTMTRNWNFEGIDNITPLLTPEIKAELEKQLQEQLPTSVQDYNIQLASIDRKYDLELEALEASIPMPKLPVAPRKQATNEVTTVTKFDFTEADINDPETKTLVNSYENLLWAILEGQEDKISVLRTGVIWSDTKLEKLSGNSIYKATLKNNDQSLELLLSPVLVGADYQKALAKYNQEMDDYNAALEERKQQLAAQKTMIAKNRATQKATLSTADMDIAIAEKREEILQELLKNQLVPVINRFTVNKLGIWNCGFPDRQTGESLEISFEDDSGETISYNRVFYVNKNQNTLRQLLKSDNGALIYQKNEEQLLWLITPDGKMVVWKPEDFEKINTSKHTFKPVMLPQLVKDEATLRAILNWEE